MTPELARPKASHPPQPTSFATTRSQVPGSRGRVLVADDDPPLLRMLALILKTRGYDVHTARDGAELIAELGARGPFDVIVSDLNMPELDGLAALKAVRAQHLELPVIFLTGNMAVESVQSAIELGAFQYLLKPIEPDSLLDVVERAVRWNRWSRSRREADIELSRATELGALGATFESALGNVWMATQPIVSWRTRDVFAYEALLRLDHPTLGTPDRLIDAAEHLGRTTRLGRVIRERVSQFMGDVPAGRPVFVNVHPGDLEDPELLSERGTLAPFARQIVLEITERGALERVSCLGARVARLRELGYRIALDDFGAGYASLSSVAQLEPDVIKLDMSLVRGIETSSLKQRLFATVAALSRDLGVALIAEGIETSGERDCALSLGGELFQGYLFARPGRGFPVPQV